MIYIYTLEDPRTDEVRYVGKTINPKDRLRHHISKARTSKSPKEHSKRWIKSLLNENLLPKMKILLLVESKEWEFYEIECIKLFSNLTNMTEGGQSVWWSKLSEEERKTFKKKMSVVNKQRIISDETREAWRQNAIKTHTGRKRSKQTKEKISAKMLGEGNPRFGVSISEDTRNKLKESSKKRKHSPETKLKMREVQKKICGVRVAQYDLNNNHVATFDSLAEASRATGASHSNISACCRGRLKKAGGSIWRYV